MYILKQCPGTNAYFRDCLTKYMYSYPGSLDSEPGVRRHPSAFIQKRYEMINELMTKMSE